MQSLDITVNKVVVIKTQLIKWYWRLNEYILYMASQMAQAVKNLPASAEDLPVEVRSLSWEDSLEEGMVTHSSILAWRILWTEESGGLQPVRSQRIGHD